MQNNNIERKLLEKIVLYLIFLLRLNFNIFPYLSIVVFTLLLLESLTYPGFVNNHLHINVEFLIISLSFSGLLSGLTYITEKRIGYFKGDLKLYEFLKYSSLVSIFPLLIALYLLDSFVSPHRDSIVFNQKNLIFPGRIFLAFCTIIFYLFIYNVFISSSFKLGKIRVFEYFKKGNFSKILPIFIYNAILLFTVVYSIKFSIPEIKYNLKIMIKNPYFSYEEKMTILVGPNYSYYMFVKNNTPEDAVILKPKQQGRWPDLSNEGYSRYFLYPRKFVSEEDLPNLKTEVTHAFLVGNIKLINSETLDRWPDFNLASKEIILYSPETKDVYKRLYMKYNFKDFQYPQYWGVIVVNNKK